VSNDTNDLLELDLKEDVIALNAGEESLDSDDEDEPAESYNGINSLVTSRRAVFSTCNER